MRIDAATLPAVLPAELEPTRAPLASGETPATRATFESMLGAFVTQANAAERVASVKTDALAAGRGDDLHGTMIAAKEAEVSLKLVGSIRNKLLDAFHELWRTNV